MIRVSVIRVHREGERIFAEKWLDERKYQIIQVDYQIDGTGLLNAIILWDDSELIEEPVLTTRRIKKSSASPPLTNL